MELYCLNGTPGRPYLVDVRGSERVAAAQRVQIHGSVVVSGGGDARRRVNVEADIDVSMVAILGEGEEGKEAHLCAS